MAESADLVGTHEIHEEYGIPRHRVFRFLARGLWPKPLVELRAGCIWKRDDVRHAVAKLKRDGLL